MNRSGVNANGRSRKAVLKMLAAVVFSFFVCWAPFHTQRLLIAVSQKYPKFFEGREDDLYAVNEKLYYLTGFFYYLSSTINPIIYNMMSAKYRRAFTATVTNCCSKKSHISSLRAQDSRRTLQSTLVSHAAGVTGRSRNPADRYLSVSQSLVASRKGSQQSTVSFVVSQGPDLVPVKLKSSSSDLEKLRKSSTDLKSKGLELEKLEKRSLDLQHQPRDLPSELCMLRKEIELSDLKLVEEKFDISGGQNVQNGENVQNGQNVEMPKKHDLNLTGVQNMERNLTECEIVERLDKNSNCKSAENCAECVL